MKKIGISQKPRFYEDQFIKISLSPDNSLVPDLFNKLPGKSIWVPCNKSMLADLLNEENLKNHFGVSRISTKNINALIESVLRKKILSTISLAKKAGRLAIGIDSIKTELLGNRDCVIIVAEGAKSLKNHSLLQAKGIQSFENLFKKEDLAKSSGKNNVKYVGILSKTFKKTIQVDLNKLKGFIENH